ncbi:hypothetical protein PTKIN_Ptkin07bG0053300 [Pterospermum kingtungense]
MSEEQDRISVLPDALLHHILSLLPTEVSIQTSILSKRWIHLWKLCPVIHIPIAEPYSPMDESDSTFIHNTLSHHQSLKLHAFSIEACIGAFWDPHFAECIEFAISRQVQILSVAVDLIIALPEEHYPLPGMFYSHENVQSLEQVSLRGFLFNPNHPMTSWCQSTRLKHLVFRSSDGILNLEVNVSRLSSLKFYGELMKISLKTLPSLVEATLFQQAQTRNKDDFEYIRFEYWEGFGDHIRTYSCKRPFIEQNSGEGEMTVEVMHNLKIVMVHHFFGYKSEIELIKRLLQKIVALETLSLTYEMLKFDPERSDEDVSRRKELVREEIFSLPRASSLANILFH